MEASTGIGVSSLLTRQQLSTQRTARTFSAETLATRQPRDTFQRDLGVRGPVAAESASPAPIAQQLRPSRPDLGVGRAPAGTPQLHAKGESERAAAPRVFDSLDMAKLMRGFGAEKGGDRFNADYDLDGNGRIDVADLNRMLENYDSSRIININDLNNALAGS